MSLNKISIYIETNTKIEYRKYTIYKATLYLKTILLKNVFLKRSVWMAGIAGDLFLKLYLVILVSGKLALRGWFGILESDTGRFLYWFWKKKRLFCSVVWILNIRKSCRDQANLPSVWKIKSGLVLWSGLWTRGFGIPEQKQR